MTPHADDFHDRRPLLGDAITLIGESGARRRRPHRAMPSCASDTRGERFARRARISACRRRRGDFSSLGESSGFRAVTIDFCLIYSRTPRFDISR